MLHHIIIYDFNKLYANENLWMEMSCYYIKSTDPYHQQLQFAHM